MNTRFLPDLVTPAQRRRFVHLFAARVAADRLLGPAFAGELSVVGHRVSRAECAWWEQALAGKCYTGRLTPEAHQLPLTGQHFAQWCHLLDATLHQHFHGPQATEARGLLRNFATMLAHWQFARQSRQLGSHTIRRVTETLQAA
ncbi:MULTISPECIES: globin family protein [Hymenobacter]|uniref:Group III truncated hemoglobin n=1 Tax=Hymenobacter jejuensis TaxID=2502781 RepID=A0A5B8A1P7_9BACT|nr:MULTISPECIES: hypothetical protein [Hymenobacter]MBC6990543.1 hypothetical protein [Hymenobacter sp. BT491]QDA61039.1 hypothetical protein FHG12_13410 [Hymenobacter jejuensis]